MTGYLSAILMLVLALSLGAWNPGRVRTPVGERILLMGWHTVACLGYWQYAQTGVADATLFLRAGATADLSLEPGTRFVVSICVVLVRWLGMDEFAGYLAFNLFGALGLLLLHGVLRDLTAGSARRSARLARLLVWLPGLSWWSSAPGKDGLAFLAAAAAVHGSVDLRHRWRWLLLGIVIMLSVRPHIAAVMAVAAAAAYLLGRQRGSRRIVALWAFAGLSVALVPFALEYVGLGDLQGADDVTSYVETRQGLNLGGGSSVDIRSMNPVERLLTFMFRPFFFDAPGLGAMGASLENLALVVFAVSAGLAAVKARGLRGYVVRYSLLYGAVTWLALAEVCANLGIAVRQKTMALPALLALGALALATPARGRTPLRVPAGRPPGPAQPAPTAHLTG